MRLYGRVPVLEALLDETITVTRLVVARPIDDIAAAAKQRGVRVERSTPQAVSRLSGNARHDQGVVAEIATPNLVELADWLAPPPDDPPDLVLLDGVTTPSNVGMIIRSAAGAGAGVVLPRRGTAELGPLVVKASAGIALKALILRCTAPAEAVDALATAGYEVVGLAAAQGASVLDEPVRHPACVVAGSETTGISEAVAQRVTTWRHIPLANGVESLNVAVATAVAVFGLAR